MITAWVVLALVAPWNIISQDRSVAVAATLNVWGWTLWTAVTTALLVPSAISLTAVRVVSPLAVIVSFVAVSPISIFASLVALIMCAAPLFTDAMVQGGAYGDEQRFALRTPVPYMAPAFTAWSLLCSSLISGTLLMAAQQWWIAAPLCVAGIFFARFVPLRIHRLARRWLVIVPAGVVVHDHLVLAETIMSTKNNIANISITRAAGDTADFTGGVMGARLAVQLRDADKVVLSRITMKTLDTTEALHVQAFTVAPRRIRAALNAIRL
jgi:hypothetical protein